MSNAQQILSEVQERLASLEGGASLQGGVAHNGKTPREIIGNIALEALRKHDYAVYPIRNGVGEGNGKKNSSWLGFIDAVFKTNKAKNKDLTWQQAIKMAKKLKDDTDQYEKWKSENGF